MDFFRGTAGGNDPETLGLPIGKGSISPPHPAVKGQTFGLKSSLGTTFLLIALTGPGQADLHRQVENQGEVRLPDLQQSGKGLQQAGGNTSRRALVGSGGVMVTIAKHMDPFFQRGFDHLFQILKAVGQVK